MRRETWTIDQCDHLSTIHQHGQAIFCFAIPTIHQVLYLSMANAGKLFNSAIILILLGTAILPLGTTQGFIKLAHDSVNYYLYCTVLYCTVLYDYEDTTSVYTFFMCWLLTIYVQVFFEILCTFNNTIRKNVRIMLGLSKTSFAALFSERHCI